MVRARGSEGGIIDEVTTKRQIRDSLKRNFPSQKIIFGWCGGFFGCVGDFFSEKIPHTAKIIF